MTWNYRVVRRSYPGGVTVYKIHEAYYPEGSDKPYNITRDAVSAMATDEDYDKVDKTTPIKSLRWTLLKMLRSLDKTVLNYEDFRTSHESNGLYEVRTSRYGR